MASGFCPNCGTPRTGERFCAKCGNDFWRSASDVGAAASPAAPLAGDTASVQPSVVAAPGGSRRTWLILGAVIFVAVVAAGGFLALANSGAFVPHHTISGTFTLLDTSTDPSITRSGSGCEGSGGYSDVRPGAGITLKDGDGKVLATSSLGVGSGTSTSCDFTFSLTNVPEVPFYTIEISHRGALSYSLTDMKTQMWDLALSLGS